MKDKVSVIVPVYNVEQYLPRTIEALLQQTYGNLEIILVDDCSTDNSKAVLERYSKEDSRIRCFYQSFNQGVSQARNKGLDEATGEWICFCDSDDWYDQSYVQKMIQCADTEGADYIICDRQLAYDDKQPIPQHITKNVYSGCDHKLAIALGPTSSCAHMIRRELFQKSGVRYPLECKNYEELPVMTALAKFATKIGVISDPIYNYYQRGNGTSASNVASGVEQSFMRSHSQLEQILGTGYENELEYHAIYALMYGEVLAMCRRNEKTKQIISKIKEYEKRYPCYQRNPYIHYLGIAKRLFLIAEQWRVVWALRLYANVHKRIVN